MNKGGIKITAGTVNGGVRIAARGITALKN
jgi:hypothetical protein